MALSILDASGNLSNQSLPTTTIPLTYSLNTTSKWIYCNYPEIIPTDGFGDSDAGNRFLNQATVAAGTHQLFYSYCDKNGLGPYSFAIQVYNPNSSSITFQTLYSAHRDSVTSGGWSPAIGEVWSDFFKSSSSSAVTIASKGVYWFHTNTIPQNCIFTGNVRFKVSNTATITVYVYKTKSKINGLATAYPKSDTGGQYSGTGDGYFFTANTITLNASELTSGKCLHLTYPSGMTSLKINSVSKTSDLIPITMVQNNTTISAPSGNLGNWGAQYYFPIKLVNDTSSAKTFSAYARTDISGDHDSWPVIQSGSLCKYAKVNPTTNNSWKWLSQTVSAGQTVSDSFQFILGTNSYGKVSIIFKVS